MNKHNVHCLTLFNNKWSACLFEWCQFEVSVSVWHKCLTDGKQEQCLRNLLLKFYFAPSPRGHPSSTSTAKGNPRGQSNICIELFEGYVFKGILPPTMKVISWCAYDSQRRALFPGSSVPFTLTQIIMLHCLQLFVIFSLSWYIPCSLSIALCFCHSVFCVCFLLVLSSGWPCSCAFFLLLCFWIFVWITN